MVVSDLLPIIGTIVLCKTKYLSSTDLYDLHNLNFIFFNDAPPVAKEGSLLKRRYPHLEIHSSWVDARRDSKVEERGHLHRRRLVLHLGEC